MNMDYADIKKEISDNWEELADSNYPEDLLTEWADSAVPVYNGDIAKDWQEMPSEFDDAWQDLGASENDTIYRRMQMCLFEYYRTEYARIYEAVKAEKESELENA